MLMKDDPHVIMEFSTRLVRLTRQINADAITALKVIASIDPAFTPGHSDLTGQFLYLKSRRLEAKLNSKPLDKLPDGLGGLLDRLIDLECERVELERKYPLVAFSEALSGMQEDERKKCEALLERHESDLIEWERLQRTRKQRLGRLRIVN
jgi:hypothetical protein